MTSSNFIIGGECYRNTLHYVIWPWRFHSCFHCSHCAPMMKDHPTIQPPDQIQPTTVPTVVQEAWPEDRQAVSLISNHAAERYLHTALLVRCRRRPDHLPIRAPGQPVSLQPPPQSAVSHDTPPPGPTYGGSSKTQQTQEHHGNFSITVRLSYTQQSAVVGWSPDSQGNRQQIVLRRPLRPSDRHCRSDPARGQKTQDSSHMGAQRDKGATAPNITLNITLSINITHITFTRTQEEEQEFIKSNLLLTRCPISNRNVLN